MLRWSALLRDYFRSLSRRPGYLPPEVIGRNAYLTPGERWVPGVGYLSRANEVPRGEYRGPSLMQPETDEPIASAALRHVVDLEGSDFVSTEATKVELRRPKSHGEVARPIPADGIPLQNITQRPAEEDLAPLSLGLDGTVAEMKHSYHAEPIGMSSTADVPPPLHNASSGVADPSLRRKQRTSFLRQQQRLDATLGRFWKQPDRTNLERWGPQRDAVIREWFEQSAVGAKPSDLAAHIRSSVDYRLRVGAWRDALAVLDVLCSYPRAASVSSGASVLKQQAIKSSNPSPPVGAFTADDLASLLDDGSDAEVRQDDSKRTEPPSGGGIAVAPTIVYSVLHRLLHFANHQRCLPLAMMSAATVAEGGYPLKRSEYNAVLAVCSVCGDVGAAARVLSQMLDKAVELEEDAQSRPSRDGGAAEEVPVPSIDHLTPSAFSFRHAVMAAVNAANWKAACGFVGLQLATQHRCRVVGCSPSRPEDIAIDTAVINESLTKAAALALEGGAPLVGLASSLVQLTHGDRSKLCDGESEAVLFNQPAALLTHFDSILASCRAAGIDPRPNLTALRTAYCGIAAVYGDRDPSLQLQLFRVITKIGDSNGIARGVAGASQHAIEDAMRVLNGVIEVAGGDIDSTQWTREHNVWRDACSLLDVAERRKSGITPSMLQSAMHHANCADYWTVALQLYWKHIGQLAEPSAEDLAPAAPDRTGRCVRAFARSKGHHEHLPGESVLEEWSSAVVLTSCPDSISHYQLSLDGCLREFFRAVSIAVANGTNASDGRGCGGRHPLLEFCLLSFPMQSWRTATLSSFLALLHEADCHPQVLSVYHAVTDDVRRYTEAVLTHVMNAHRLTTTPTAGDDARPPVRRKEALPLREPGARSLDGPHRTAHDLSRIKKPSVAMNMDSLAIVMESCAKLGMWRLALQCVEWMANCFEEERDHGQREEKGDADDDADQEILTRAIVAVKGLCSDAGYRPDQWRVPHEVP